MILARPTTWGKSREAAAALASRRTWLLADGFPAGLGRDGPGAGRAAGFAGRGRGRRGAAAGGNGYGLYDQAG